MASDVPNSVSNYKKTKMRRTQHASLEEFTIHCVYTVLKLQTQSDTTKTISQRTNCFQNNCSFHLSMDAPFLSTIILYTRRQPWGLVKISHLTYGCQIWKSLTSNWKKKKKIFILKFVNESEIQVLVAVGRLSADLPVSDANLGVGDKATETVRWRDGGGSWCVSCHVTCRSTHVVTTQGDCGAVC